MRPTQKSCGDYDSLNQSHLPFGGRKTDTNGSRSITRNGLKITSSLVARSATLSGGNGTTATDLLTVIQVDPLLTS